MKIKSHVPSYLTTDEFSQFARSQERTFKHLEVFFEKLDARIQKLEAAGNETKTCIANYHKIFSDELKRHDRHIESQNKMLYIGLGIVICAQFLIQNLGK